MSTYLAENAFGFLPVPILITDPAVDGGLGLAGLFFHESEEMAEERRLAMLESENASRYLLPPNVTFAAAAYTGNDSLMLGGGHLGFFKEGRIRYTGFGGHADFNLDFYGTGDLALKRPVEINTTGFNVMQWLRFQLGDSRFFLGLSQRYTTAEVSPTNIGEILGEILPPGLLPPEDQDKLADKIREVLTTDVTLSGVGFTLDFDNRDNVFSPHSGYEYSLEQIYFRDLVGSDLEYELTTFDGHNYWPVSKSFRVNLRLNAERAASKDPLPPFATPAIVLRGVPIGRYQGNSIGVVEGELVWQIDPRWALLGFGGAGYAATDFEDLTDSPSRVGKGVGFRYQIARRYGFDVGIDVGWGPEDTVVYIQSGTAW